MSADDMVTMVGPNGSVHEVDRETAAAATALLVDIETRITAAYEQGKEVGRVNGAARLDEIRQTLALVREQRDAWAWHEPDFEAPPAPCGDGRCYCGGCVL